MNYSVFVFLHSEHLSCMFVSNNKKYLFHTVFHNIHAKQLTMKLPKMPTKNTRFLRIIIQTHAQIPIMSNRYFVTTATFSRVSFGEFF